MENDAVDPDTAVAQLAALQADRVALADRALQPWWYDVLLGMAVFGLLSVVAAGNVFATLAGVALFSAGLGWLVSTYRRRTGFWVDGFRRGAMRRASSVYLVVYVLVVVPALVLALGFDRSWALVAAGAVAGVTAAVTSRWAGHLYVRELRGLS
ncbi:hypothetical protein SAMN05660359_01538 [Geodermatophilus obscurus]|uniref:Transmembrane protein n=1 Tax=Geodermatophilus obscurus TaxID=1861 RepID=A0A1I5ELW2_9ACTN|nr:hypothetical protein [Geodermatophilus obscurus]SFO12041.1 hypothetical protein SAMN05660359_01538 [Geodermatophilus obscurus]